MARQPSLHLHRRPLFQMDTKQNDARRDNFSTRRKLHGGSVVHDELLVGQEYGREFRQIQCGHQEESRGSATESMSPYGRSGRQN